MCHHTDFLSKRLHPVDSLWLNTGKAKAGMIFKVYQLIGALVVTDLI